MPAKLFAGNDLKPTQASQYDSCRFLNRQERLFVIATTVAISYYVSRCPPDAEIEYRIPV